MCEQVHQEVEFRASPEKIYEIYLDSRAHAAFSGEPASLSGEEGGQFSCWGGQIVGRQVELRPGKRIVQAWRVSAWPDGVYSIVRIELHASGAGTRLVLDHTGIPQGASAGIAAGWPMRYWERMKKHLGEG
jgi:activator of HSP90 ATPase